MTDKEDNRYMLKLKLGLGIAFIPLLVLATILFIIPQPYDCAFLMGCWHRYYGIAVISMVFGIIFLVILVKIRKMSREELKAELEQAKRYSRKKR